jgi:hypothetical protein
LDGLGAIVLFMIGSVVGGLANDMGVLITARVLQGLGGGGPRQPSWSRQLAAVFRKRPCPRLRDQQEECLPVPAPRQAAVNYSPAEAVVLPYRARPQPDRRLVIGVLDQTQKGRT